MKLHITAVTGLLGAFAVIFFYAPAEATQGMVHKIFYIHVASAITMYLGLFISFVAAFLYLLEKKVHWDEICVSAAEVSFFLCTIVLVTGPLWGRPVWGVWWDWDPRLTTTFLLWLLYAAYLVLRGYFGSSPSGRTITSVLAILAFLDVPLIHFSVRLWRGIHPAVLSPEGGMPYRMKLTLVVTLVAVVLMFFSLLAARFRLERGRNHLSQLRLAHSENA